MQNLLPEFLLWRFWCSGRGARTPQDWIKQKQDSCSCKPKLNDTFEPTWICSNSVQTHLQAPTGKKLCDDRFGADISSPSGASWQSRLIIPAQDSSTIMHLQFSKVKNYVETSHKSAAKCDTNRCVVLIEPSLSSSFILLPPSPWSSPPRTPPPPEAAPPPPHDRPSLSDHLSTRT